eukprot:3342233-Alexandrium_andersonii.AAC.1
MEERCVEHCVAMRVLVVASSTLYLRRCSRPKHCPNVYSALHSFLQPSRATDSCQGFRKAQFKN